MEISYKNDFYDAVNADWMSNAQIPKDHSSTGGFMDLIDDIDVNLQSDLKNMLKDESNIQDNLIKEMLKFYKISLDFDERSQLGWEPIKPYLKKIEDLKNWHDLNNNLVDLFWDGVKLPINLSIDPDLKNNMHGDKLNVLWASGVDLFLPDRSYYENSDNGKYLMNAFTDMMKKIMDDLGYSKKESTEIIEGAKTFDAKIAPFRKNSEELNDVSKLYNPTSSINFIDQIKCLNVENLISSLLDKIPETIIVTEPKFYKNLNNILKNTNFKDIKNWMLVNFIKDHTPYLSNAIRKQGEMYQRILSGQKEAMEFEKSAFYLTKSFFDQVIGKYYGEKYFGITAKADVYNMVKSLIKVYEGRLSNNTWLSKSTKQKAITKLNSLGILVGYPDHITSVYKNLKTRSVDEGGNLFNNVKEFQQIFLKDQLNKFEKPVDYNLWHMSADTVNAYYSPEENLICFPAAILQAPFYSLKQSASQNYGGIGAVIAHEISHAFDPNGALFDEHGNLENWWKSKDLDCFKKLSKKMVEEFDGVPFSEGVVNGNLVVTENVADEGGLHAALEALKNVPSYSLKEFFINWATIWRTKSTTERKQLLLSIDVHAPSKLRANIQVQNFQEFHDTFNIHEGDRMYRSKDKRVNIW